MALGKKNPDGYFRNLPFLKKLFWVYFLLLIFEGALRKWVVPQLSAPLLVIRDPVGIMIIWEAYRSHKWPMRWSAVVALLSAALMTLFVVQLAIGNNPLIVGLYGLRSYLLPFIVIFIMGENLDEEDLRKLGRCTLWILLPMTVLEVMQYVSPTSSFLNKGAYEGGAQIIYVRDHSRASGTFSFVAGAEAFDTLAGAFILYGMATPGFAKKWLLWAGAFALVISIPMMGSRSVVVVLAAVVVCMGLAAMMGISQAGRVLRAILPLVLVGYLASLLPVFSTAMGSFSQRVSGAALSEGGGSQLQTLYYRTLDPAVVAIQGAYNSSDWTGIGIGRGAIAVQALLVGTTEASAGEDEFSREVIEMGPIAGIAFMIFKLFLGIYLLSQALAQARRLEPLALLLFPIAIDSFMSTPEQPTEQGFMVMAAALCIAAANIQVKAATAEFPLALRRQQVLERRRAQELARQAHQS